MLVFSSVFPPELSHAPNDDRNCKSRSTSILYSDNEAFERKDDDIELDESVGLVQVSR